MAPMPSVLARSTAALLRGVVAAVAVVALALPAGAQGLGDETSTTGAARDLPRTMLEVEQRDDGDSSPLWWVLSGVAAVAAIAVGGTVLGRRMRS